MENCCVEVESDDDWFEQDEEVILQKFETKLQERFDEKVEHISGVSSVDAYLKEYRVNAAAAAQQVDKTKRISIDELRKYAKCAPLDAFLFVFTGKDFFASQILPNDAEERVQIYTRILAAVCSLSLPGFHSELLLRFVANNELLEQLQFLATKFLTKHQVSESKEGRQMLKDMETLFLEAFNENLLTVNCKNVLQNVYKLIKCEDIWQRIKQFDSFTNALQTNFDETENIQVKTIEQVYPSLEELLQPIKPIDDKKEFGNTIQNYIHRQKYVLKYDFMTSLRSIVQALRTKSEIPTEWFVVQSSTIIINEELSIAQRNERVFVDVLCGKQENRLESISSSISSKLKRLKVGTLICLTTSCNFDNLIYATFNYTNEHVLNAGYLSIEILRQYNIGSICNQKFIMFEAPTFFEPYRHVYNCLNDFKLKNELPFHKYLIPNKLNLKIENLKPPAYLREQGELQASKRILDNLSNLNATQLRAYKSALKQELCLIQGPPGTGKTYLSVQLICTLMENTKNTPIVLITYTNDSLDKLLLSLSQHTKKYIRFGSRSREAQEPSKEQLAAMPNLKKLYFLQTEEMRKCSNELKHLQDLFDGSDEEYEKIVATQQKVNFVEKKLNCLKIIFQYYLACEQQLIAMTTTFAAKTQFIFNLLQSKIVFFEEAAQILESHVIACLSAHTQHIIMVGDHMQLQPFTSNYKLRRDYSLNTSLFERLIQEGLTYTPLVIQYRMRPEIAKLLSPLFYNELHNAECVQNYETVRGMTANLCFCTHQHTEFISTDGDSFANEYEAKKLINLTEHLCCVAKYAVDDIAILTPYVLQATIIRKYLANSQISAAAERVSTVDSFQGLEANIVLVSLVRSNNRNAIGFLNDKHRICVLLSRARLGLYIIGDIDLLSNNSNNWKIIKNMLDKKAAIGNEFPYSKKI